MSSQDHCDKTDEWDMKGGFRPPAPTDRFLVDPPGEAAVDRRSFPNREMAEAYAEAYCPPHTRIVDRYPELETSAPASAPVNPPNPKQRYGDTKVNLGLVPSSGVIFAALGFHDGAIKYGPFNWRKDAVEVMTYISACRRHIDAFVDGEELSEIELWRAKGGSTISLGGKPHLGHAIACLMILADAISLNHVIDNRPLPGPAPVLFSKWKIDLAR